MLAFLERAPRQKTDQARVPGSENGRGSLLNADYARRPEHLAAKETGVSFIGRPFDPAENALSLRRLDVQSSGKMPRTSKDVTTLFHGSLPPRVLGFQLTLPIQRESCATSCFSTPHSMPVSNEERAGFRSFARSHTTGKMRRLTYKKNPVNNKWPR